MLPILAKIAASVGLSMADRHLSDRADKRIQAKQNRQDALNQVINQLSSRPSTQMPPRQQQQAGASPLQTIMRDPLVRDLLSQKLGGLTGGGGDKPKDMGTEGIWI